MKALPSLLVIAGAAVALGACSDTDERVLESRPGENGAVMVVVQAYTVDEYLTYLRIFPEVPAGNVDFRPATTWVARWTSWSCTRTGSGRSFT